MKIYFEIPSFIKLQKFNMYFLNYFNKHREQFYPNIEISAIYDNPPGSVWGGGRAILENADGLTKEDYIQLIKATIVKLGYLNIPIALTWSNMFTNENSLSDSYCNTVTDVASKSKLPVYIIVANDRIEQYIRTVWPSKFKYISSITKCLNLDEFKLELKKDYSYCVLPSKYNHNREFFKALAEEERKKIMLLVNSKCPIECQRKKEHYEYISQCQLLQEIDPFLSQEYFNCRVGEFTSYDNLFNGYNARIKVDELYNYFVPMGINNFKIDGREAVPSVVLEEYLYYMCKPEYINEARLYIIGNFESACTYWE